MMPKTKPASRIAAVLLSVALTISLCGCGLSSTLTVGDLVVSYPAGITPRHDTPQRSTMTAGPDDRFLTLRETTLLTDDYELGISVTEYSGATFDEALAYAEDQAHPMQPRELTEESQSIMEKYRVDPSNYEDVQVQVDPPEQMTLNGARAFTQRTQTTGPGDKRTITVTECIDLGERTFGVVSCISSEAIFTEREQLIDEVLSSARPA